MIKNVLLWTIFVNGRLVDSSILYSGLYHLYLYCHHFFSIRKRSSSLDSYALRYKPSLQFVTDGRGEAKIKPSFYKAALPQEANKGYWLRATRLADYHRQYGIRFPQWLGISLAMPKPEIRRLLAFS